MEKILKFLYIRFLCMLFCFLTSCGILGLIFKPDLEKEKKERFYRATGHKLLKIFTKENKLGYIYDKGVFIKKVWGGKIIKQPLGQSIKLTYTKKDFDKLKAFFGEDLSLGPELENIHHIVLYLEDIYIYELTDFQPLIEYMGKENLPLLKQDFVVSMLKVTKFSIQAYQKVMGEFGVEYRPYTGIKLRGATGTSVSRGEEQVGYNIFVGYKLYNGSKWIQSFENMPKVDIWILQPENDAVIDRVRARVKGTIPKYPSLKDEYKNRMRLYIMTRDEYEDYWILQSKARIDTYGYFEGIVKLGTLEKGNGHRYSIAVFITYFDINREVNSKIPFLPFNKGKYIINVKREDNF